MSAFVGCAAREGDKSGKAKAKAKAKAKKRRRQDSSLRPQRGVDVELDSNQPP
jgi:hypothetical protein